MYNRKYLRELYKDDSESCIYDDKRYNRDGEIEEYGQCFLLQCCGNHNLILEVLTQHLFFDIIVL